MNRAAVARERLETVSALAREAKEAGPPCSECRYRTLLGNCGNPAYAEVRFDPAKGVYEESFFTSVVKARAKDGLCGPEAMLFEAQTLPAVLGKALVSGTWMAWQTVAFGIVALALLAWLLR